MIRTDGRPTIAMRESDALLQPARHESDDYESLGTIAFGVPDLPEVINDGRDPGDEHHDPPKRKQLTARWTVDGTDSGNGTKEEIE